MWLRSIALAMTASSARYAVPVLAGLEIGIVLIEGRSWTSEWRWAVDWAGAGIFLSGPLAGGLACWQAQAARRAPGEAAWAVGGRGRLFAFNAGGVFMWASLAHALVLLLVVVECYRSGLRGWPNPALFLLHLSLLAACVSVGYLVGQFSMSRLLAPILSVALLVFVIQASNGALPTLWVEVAGATAPLAGLRYRPEVIALQLVMFWASALVAMGVAQGLSRPGLRLATVASGSVVLIFCASSLALADQRRFSIVQASELTQRCFGKRPEVCVVGDTRQFGSEIQKVFADFHLMAGSSASLPSKYVQVMGPEGPSATQRQFVVDPGAIQGGKVAPEVLIRYVVWNRNCLLGEEPPPGRAVDLLADLEMVLLARTNSGPASDSRLLAAFDALPSTVRDTWIAEALRASDTCAFDAVPEWLTTS